MKKIIAVLCSAMMCCLFAAGCSDGGGQNYDTPVGMLSPHVTSYGEFIAWDDVPEAEHYEIYKDGELIESVSDSLYRVGELEADTKYSIIAVDANGQKTEPSNTVNVSKNVYSQSEILNLGSRDYKGTVKSSIRKVILGGDSSVNASLDLRLEKRNADLVIEMKNIAVSGSIYTDDGSYKRADHDYNVIFRVDGACSIAGLDGDDGFDYSDSVYNNKEIDGGDGSDGDVAVLVGSAVVCGGGSLMLYGGKGGNGGNGSASTKNEKKNGPGAGSNGGDGGSAIKCSYFALDMQDGGTVGITDGTGGKKGEPGVNGSIFTGPAASVMWKDMYDIGKAGKAGKSVLSRKKIIKGTLNI